MISLTLQCSDLEIFLEFVDLQSSSLLELVVQFLSRDFSTSGKSLRASFVAESIVLLGANLGSHLPTMGND